MGKTDVGDAEDYLAAFAGSYLLSDQQVIHYLRMYDLAEIISQLVHTPVHGFWDVAKRHLKIAVALHSSASHGD